MLNVVGEFLTLRPDTLSSLRLDSSASPARSYQDAMTAIAQLEVLEISEYVQEINRITHETMVHLRPKQIADAGYGNGSEIIALNLRVPIWENYLLFLLSYLKPDTYRDYEFCRYDKALERGIGRCGQQSLVVVSLLDSQGIEAGFIDWSDHHAVAIAKTGPSEWYILDPDYNISFPYRTRSLGANTPEAFPDLAAALLREHPDQTIIQHPDGTNRTTPERLYKTDGQTVSLGGPSARWGRACPIERVAYILKWVLPILLLLPWLLAFFMHRRKNRAEPSTAS